MTQFHLQTVTPDRKAELAVSMGMEGTVDEKEGLQFRPGQVHQDVSEDIVTGASGAKMVAVLVSRGQQHLEQQNVESGNGEKESSAVSHDIMSQEKR